MGYRFFRCRWQKKCRKAGNKKMLPEFKSLNFQLIKYYFKTIIHV